MLQFGIFSSMFLEGHGISRFCRQEITILITFDGLLGLRGGKHVLCESWDSLALYHIDWHRYRSVPAPMKCQRVPRGPLITYVQ